MKAGGTLFDDVCSKRKQGIALQTIVIVCFFEKAMADIHRSRINADWSALQRAIGQK